MYGESEALARILLAPQARGHYSDHRHINFRIPHPQMVWFCQSVAGLTGTSPEKKRAHLKMGRIDARVSFMAFHIGYDAVTCAPCEKTPFDEVLWALWTFAACGQRGTA